MVKRHNKQNNDIFVNTISNYISIFCGHQSVFYHSIFTEKNTAPLFYNKHEQMFIIKCV